MIASFRCKETRSLFNGGTSRRFQAFSAVALRKLDMLDAAISLDDLRMPPRTGSKPSRATGRGNTAFASTTSGVCALSGAMAHRMTWKSSTTTRRPPCAFAPTRAKS